VNSSVSQVKIHNSEKLSLLTVFPVLIISCCFTWQ